jgi:hypothetical protein
MDFLIEPAGDLHLSAANRAPFRLVPNPDALPRAWIVHRVRHLEPLQQITWSTLDRRTEQVFLAEGQPRDLRQEAVVEANVAPPAVQASAFPSNDQPAADTCTITDAQPTRIVLQVELREPGFLVLRDAFAPGWSCRSHTDFGRWVSRPVLRANRVMRGVALPAGRHELVFRYRPQTLFWGGLISLFSWIGLGFMAKPRVIGLLRKAGQSPKSRADQFRDRMEDDSLRAPIGRTKIESDVAEPA